MSRVRLVNERRVPARSQVPESPTRDLDPATRQLSRWFRIAKRTFDIGISLLTLVLTLPLFILIAVLIKTSSSGPVFFTHTRVGRDGRLFTMIKFRTMLPGTHDAVLGDAELRRRYVANGYKLPPDTGRVTGIGRLLRKTSLDELPQLLNVLVGQMSIVGIRPLVRDEFGERSGADRAIYTSLRPGLTGLWQVTGRSRLQHTTRIELDREYAESCSIWRDIKIMIKTPLALMRIGETH